MQPGRCREAGARWTRITRVRGGEWLPAGANPERWWLPGVLGWGFQGGIKPHQGRTVTPVCHGRERRKEPRATCGPPMTQANPSPQITKPGPLEGGEVPWSPSQLAANQNGKPLSAGHQRDERHSGNGENNGATGTASLVASPGPPGPSRSRALEGRGENGPGSLG